MARCIWPLVMLMLATSYPPAWGQATKKPKTPPLGDILPLLDAKSPHALAGVLRGAMIQFAPSFWALSSIWSVTERCAAAGPAANAEAMPSAAAT